VHSKAGRSQLSLRKVKVKVLPYSLPSVGPGADPGVQAVSPQVTLSRPPSGRLFTRPAVTFPAEERHRPLAGTKLYCLVTEAHACEQLARGCYLETRDLLDREPTPLPLRHTGHYGM